MGQVLGCVCVGQSTVAVKEQFGKFDEVLEPGCHCLPWCLGYQVAGELSLRVQQIYVNCETKIKDNVCVYVMASIQYRVLSEKAHNAFYKLVDTKEHIQSYVFDVISASVSKLCLDAAREQKNDIAMAVKDRLQKAMSAYGYEIVETLIMDIEPHEHMKVTNAVTVVKRRVAAGGMPQIMQAAAGNLSGQATASAAARNIQLTTHFVQPQATLGVPGGVSVSIA